MAQLFTRDQSNNVPGPIHTRRLHTMLLPRWTPGLRNQQQHKASSVYELELVQPLLAMFKHVRPHEGARHHLRHTARSPRGDARRVPGASEAVSEEGSLFDEDVVQGLANAHSLQRDDAATCAARRDAQWNHHPMSPRRAALRSRSASPLTAPPELQRGTTLEPPSRWPSNVAPVAECAAPPVSEPPATPRGLQNSSAAGPAASCAACTSCGDPASPQDASRRGSLQLDSFLMSHLPTPVSLFSLQGRVVHQNQASKDYMGDVEALCVQGSPSSADFLPALASLSESGLRRGPAAVAAPLQPEAPSSASDLQRLFSMDPQMLVDLQKVVLLGKVWVGTVRLPAHGQRLFCKLPSKSRLKVLVGGKSIDSAASRDGASGSGWDKVWDVDFTSPVSGPRSSASPSRMSMDVNVAAAGALSSQERRLGTRCSQRNRGTSPHSLRLGRSSCRSSVLASGGSGPVAPSSAAHSVWHEVVAKVVRDPLAGRDFILLTQTDVTSKVTAEQRSGALLEAEHAVLELLFPRHIIEHIVAAQDSHDSGAESSGSGGSLSEMLSPMRRRRRSSVGWPSAGGGADAGPPPVLPPRKAAAAKQLVPCSTSHEEVTIMFADIVGFTSMCKCVPPATVMAFLNELYSALDDLLGIFNVYKVETAGDCYIIAGGLMRKDEDGYTSVRTDVDPKHALTVLEFAKAMLQESRKVLNPVTGEPIQMRIGMHSGPVVSGVVGTKMPRFCLFGDSMNTAQRMESKSRPGAIHVSEATQKLLPREMWVPTGGVELKGLGMRPSYFWSAPDPRWSPAGSPTGERRSGSGSSHPRGKRGKACASCHDLHA